MAVWSVGWRGALRRAHGGGKADYEYYEYWEYYRWSVVYCEPCAPEISWYMAHTLSRAYPSILSIPSIPSWPCPQYRLCTMCLASQQTTQPCAIKIQKHMALTAPCDPPPYTSVHIRTYPYCLARSIVTALSPHIKGKDALGIAGAGGKDGELDGKCFTGNRDPAQTLIIVIHTDLFPGTVRSLHFQTELPHQC